MDYYLRTINLNDIGEDLYDLANVFTRNKQEYTVEQEIILRKAIMANANSVCKIYLCFERESHKLVGMIKLLLEPKLHNGGAYVGHIEDVAVLPDCQKKGIGKMMVKKVMDMCKTFGCYKIVLCCNEPLVGFYEDCGFIQKGTELSCYF
ncbi:GNAT family N-acetyltransferase [bacterium]|nr:GNAT family N-acetyltransferase [bacterium]